MDLGDITVSILAGGRGTRLQSVLPATPKLLAPVGGRPFLDHLLQWLARQSARQIVLCLGYRAADVQAYLEAHPFPGLDIRTVVEPEPLGTGGALAYARAFLGTDPVLVMNGDTFVDVDLNLFLASHCAAGAPASLVSVAVPDAARYGRVQIDRNSRVVRFEEKDPAAIGSAWINAGVYLFSKPVLEIIGRLSQGSLERDVLEKMPAAAIHAFRANGRFLDIGTPETLALAPEVLAS